MIVDYDQNATIANPISYFFNFVLILQGSECEEMSSQTPTPDRVSSDGSNVKTCVDCGTSKTPLWRGGPAGPKVQLNPISDLIYCTF